MTDEMTWRLAAHRAWLESDGARGERLADVDLRGADLRGCDLRGADLPAGVPVVPHLAAAILAAIGPGGERLDMTSWHCGATHCMAGWTTTLAGEAGAALERVHGTQAAAALIWAASTGLPVPDYYAASTAAIEALRRAAAKEAV